MTKEKKLVALVGILPVMLDFMEDIRYDFPKVYSRQIKKSGNDFIEAVEKQCGDLYSRINGESDEDLKDFYNDVISVGISFRQWLDQEEK